MDAITLTKLQRPRVGRRLVARPQLLEQLDAAQSLTLVLAPAGGGKTTLLSMWLETCNLPAAWLSLDQHDNDLDVFVTSLIMALRTLFPVVARTLAVIKGVTLPPAGTIARSLLNDLATVEQDFVLVLDDYEVIRNQAIHDLITDILLHPPHTLHLVIASRHDPPLPLAALRARGDVTELRKSDLWFTPEETRRFLVESMQLALDERAIADLTASNQGWPVGLRLAGLYLRQRPAVMGAADTLDANRYIMDYLAAEVLSQLPISIQEFLIKTSLLDQLYGPLCEAVTGMSEYLASGQPILEWLERSDLFLTSLGERQHWYRCHHLFQQFLRARMEQIHSPSEIGSLQLRASAWWAANGDLDQALHHALASGDMAAAAQLVAQHRHAVVNRAEWQRLNRWARLFPPEVRDEWPDLLLIEVQMKSIHNKIGEVPALLDRIETLLPGLPPKVAERLQGEVAARRAVLFFWTGDVASSVTAAHQALEKVPLEWWYVRSFTRVFLAYGYMVSGDPARAFATLYATGEPEQGRDYRLLRTGFACFTHWMAGDMAGMAKAAREVLTSWTLSDVAEIVTWSQHHLGLYHYQRNDLAGAEEYMLPLALQPHSASSSCFLNSAVILARIRQFQGSPEEALAIADRIESFALEAGSEGALFSAQALRAELALRQGRLDQAAQWAEQCGPFRRLPTPYAFVPAVVLALIRLAQDTPASRQQARELLLQMDDYYRSTHFTTLRISVLALQALLHSAEGNEQGALAALSNSITLAAPGGFLRLFVDLGTALKPLLQKLAHQGVAPAYINEILAAFGPDEASPNAGQSLTLWPGPTPPGSTLLTNRELDVLQLLARRYTDKEIADALVISPKTVSSHIDHLGDKLGVRGRRAIVAAANAQGFLT